MAFTILPPSLRARGVTAVLGPTNTGKTHLAIERMLGHGAGVIGLPLRLLAREVYARVVERVGPNVVALVTGEEKIKPEGARYWICTAEAMPRDLDLPFMALDEVQIAGDLERGHVFTDRMLNRRGSAETLLIGSGTMRPIIETLIPGVTVVSRPRLSNLTFTGERKLSRLPRRTAIVAFSAEEVYAIAEVIRRQRGGAAVVLGALSPRTRNAQVEIYQSGDVDYLVATDAIGMGLNLDVDHVAFAGDRKFDGYQFRRLTPAEFGQIAGRAGRHIRDGSFGTTGRCDPFDTELAAEIEAHDFETVRVLQWRNPQPDFSSIAALQESLARVPTEQGLTRAPEADDIRALAIVSRDDDIRAMAKDAKAVERLWEVAALPDYRKISPHAHADLVGGIYGFLMRQGVIPDDWFARQVAFSDRTDGDIDTLSTRIAHIRTWTFAANRPDWLGDPEHWQGVTRGVEDRLSDALHERLAQRFVDRRTSVLLRRLRENAMLETEITRTGDVIVEGQHVGQLQGFQFAPDPTAGDGESGRALRAAAAKALAGEIEARAQTFSQAPDTEFALSADGTVRWVGAPVAKLVAGETTLAPRIRLLADEQLTGPSRDLVQTRLDIWIANRIKTVLGPLLALGEAEDVTGLARGVAFQLVEALGVLDRARVTEDVKALDQAQRAILRKHGVRFGAYHIYLPALMKPGPRALAVQLWALKHGGLDRKGLDEVPHLAASGRTSIRVDEAIDNDVYRLTGYRVAGDFAVRVDILERLADLIRPAIAYRPGETVGEPPDGSADGDAFVVTQKMTSLTGCSGEDFASILRGLGYRAEKRKGPAITKPIKRPAPTEPVQAPPAEAVANEPVPALPAEAVANEPVAGELEPSSETAIVDAGPEAAVPLVEVEPVVAPEPVIEGQAIEGEPDVAAAVVPETGPGEPAESDAVTVAVADDIEVEIWRPGRFERRPNRPPRHDQRPRGEHRPAAPGDKAAAPADGQPRPERRRFDHHRKPERRPDQPKPAGDAKPVEARRPEGKPFRKRDDQGGKPDRDKDRGPRNWSSEAPRGGRDRAPDPDSPFAKLLALKEQMQGGKKT